MKKWLLLLAAGILLFSFVGWFTSGENSMSSVEKTNYLDIHAHVACLEEENYDCYVNPDMLNNYRFPFLIKAMGTTKKEIKEKGSGVVADNIVQQIRDSHRVGGVVILAMDGAVKNGELDKERTQVYFPNDFVFDQAARYPELYFGASINPYRTDAIERLVKVKEQGALLIKWIPAIMHIDPADPAITDFYKKMVELKIPLLSHAGQERAFPNAKDELSDPRKLELPLSLGVTVIAAHIGTTGEYSDTPSFDLTIPMIKKHPNLYADISSLTQVNKLNYLWRALQEEGVADHLVYGSDWPLQMAFLVNPLYHFRHISFSQIRNLFRIKNKWDRDVYLKEALGVKRAILERSRKLLIQ